MIDWTLFVLAVGLAMDAFAVAATSGLTRPDMSLPQALVMALSFGLFQALMPLAGWLAGGTVQAWIAPVDHWVCLGLLTVVGTRMILGACRADREAPGDPLRPAVLLTLSLATSIDALAVGFTFAVLSTPIVTPALVIGAVTFILSLAGVYLGRCCGRFLDRKLEFLGGLILIGIGIKIVVHHQLTGT